MEFNPTRTIVHNEGCDLHYWYQGKGPLMLFVPGGNGHGRQFNNIIVALSDRFTCATFDRRQMSTSQVPVNKPLSMTQQARDVRAIIKAIGFEKAILFGSSSGGIIGYQFAHDFPERVVHLISHEAGISALMPEASEIYDWMYDLIELHKNKGLDAVAAEFDKCLIGYGDEGLPKAASPEPENIRNFWENEFPSQVGYCPNFFRIKENRTSIGVMRGVRCKEAFYSRAIEAQAKILECPRMAVPGHHEGFQCETKEFVPALLEMLDILEKRKESA